MRVVRTIANELFQGSAELQILHSNLIDFLLRLCCLGPCDLGVCLSHENSSTKLFDLLVLTEDGLGVESSSTLVGFLLSIDRRNRLGVDD